MKGELYESHIFWIIFCAALIFAITLTNNRNIKVETKKNRTILKEIRSQIKQKEQVKSQAKTYIVTATVYNPCRLQCDGDPRTTADGSKINLDDLKKGKIRWIALSRDLLKRWNGEFSYGDKILVQGCDEMDGVWQARDCMNSRYKRYIDFLCYEREFGKWYNVSIRKITEE